MNYFFMSQNLINLNFSAKKDHEKSKISILVLKFESYFKYFFSLIKIFG